MLGFVFFGQDTGKVVMEKTQQGIEVVKDCFLVIARLGGFHSKQANIIQLAVFWQ